MPIARATILQVTIANGTSLSGGVEIGAGSVVAIGLPPMTSAALSFQASEDGVTWREMFDSAGAAVSVAASTFDRQIQAPASLRAAPWLKVRSGTSGAPVNQGGDRLITLIVK